MYRNKTVCVVIPAYNEELLIAHTITSVPTYVDTIVVVDDGSSDATLSIVQDLCSRDQRLIAIPLSSNGGVGVAIRTGYAWCRSNNIDVAVVMAGDGQMDPVDLQALLDPVVEDRADYSKGNRLVTGQAWKKMPRVRYLGSAGLTLLTKVASGYWHVTDSQSGYTAINNKALNLIPIEDIYPRYGMPNDLLVTLNIYNLRVSDVPVSPIYGNGEKSGIRVGRAIFSLSFLMCRLFIRRMIQKYIIRDFHPLIFFYLLGLSLLLADLPLIVRMFYIWRVSGSIPPINALSVVFCTVIAFQSILFAMLFDMESNRDLKGS